MSSPASVLRDAFERHTWATLRLLDHIEGMDAAVYVRGVPGTYGPIDETLTHLVNADDRYLQRLEHPVLPPYEPAPAQTIEELRARVRAHAPHWTSRLDRLEGGSLHASIPADRIPGGIDPAETLLLLQALHHGDDHRAQVCSTLGSLDLEVPDLDVWAFWDDQR